MLEKMPKVDEIVDILIKLSQNGRLNKTERELYEKVSLEKRLEVWKEHCLPIVNERSRRDGR